MAGQFNVRVASNESLTPHMRRIVLEGDALARFPADQESGYVKLLLPPESGDGKPRMRSYTIRAFDGARRALTLDFVDHGDGGPASAWARRVRPGEGACIRGPGGKKLADPAADWYLLAGDLSALPALAVNLERLPDGARGYAFIEVPSATDRQRLEHPDGMIVRWIVNGDAAIPNVLLVDALMEARWLPGRPYPWFAGEFDAMRRVRRYFRDERRIARDAMYVSCYWKLGDSDEAMKQAKRADPEV